MQASTGISANKKFGDEIKDEEKRKENIWLMNTLKEIGNVLQDASNIYIYPHIDADGDTIGSSVALCRVLRQLGKEAYVLIEEPVPDNLQFMDRGYCTMDEKRLETADLSICVDCGDKSRFPGRVESFIKSDVTVCLDHHATTEEYADYNYVDPSASATGEIVFDLIQTMAPAGTGSSGPGPARAGSEENNGWKIDKETGEALFAAITTDTGDFQYSNATKRTHEIVAQLYDSGMDHHEVSVEIYENVKFNQLELSNKVMSTARLFADGKGIIAHVTQDMLKKTGSTMDDTSGMVATLRSIAGVEVSCFLKETEEGSIKVSMRAKSYADVSGIAESHDGGGHARAAGCTLHMSMKKATKLMEEEITQVL